MRFDALLHPFYPASMPLKDFKEYALMLHGDDTVAVLKKAVKAGDELVNGRVHLLITENIGAGHKVAMQGVSKAEPIRKYGQIIGFAKTNIPVGAHVHTHNLELKDYGRDYQFCADAKPVNSYRSEQMRCFQGYARPGGRVGTRNYVAVISSVNCSASVSHYVRDRFRTTEFQRDFPNVDGVIAFTHKAGCAMDPGEPQQLLQRVLAGIARHPNISGYVMIGLGCESNQVDAIRRAYQLDQAGPGESDPIFMNIQASGGVRKT